MNDEDIKPIGVWRGGDGELRVGYSDGTTELWYDVSGDDQEACISARRRNGFTLFPTSTDWYWSIYDGDLQGRYDGGKGGDSGDDDNDGSDDGDGQGDGDEGDQGQSDGQGDGDEESEGEGSQGESKDGDGESKDEQEGDEMNFEDRDKTGEDDGFPENPFADELWDLYRPRVREIAHHYAEYAANYAIKHGGGGSGSGSGLTLKFEKGKTGTVEGVTHEMFPKVLAAVQRGVNVYLPGPPGTGKSHMVKQIAEALDIPFGVTSFSPMSTESKLLGFRSANGDTVRTVYRDRYEFGGGMLMDELDNANGAVIAVLNGGLANGFMEFPDGVVDRHPDFVCIATANTLGTGPTAEFAGRQKLDPATLNRFVKIFIDTDETMEDSIVTDMLGETTATAWLKKVRHVRRAVADLRIKHFVTMRDSINGARLIAPGAGKFSQVEALHHTVLAVLPDDAVDKIKKWRG
jgi:AAA domain (dynein-related subfamily)